MLSHKTIPFPFAIVCHHRNYQEELERLLADVRRRDWTGMLPVQAAQILVKMDSVLTFPGDKWYPAPTCAAPAIYSH